MELTIDTTKKQECIGIKNQIQKRVKKSKIKQGICFLYNKHTTSALIIS